MSRRISRAAFRALRESIAPFATAARVENAVLAKIAAAKKAAVKAKASLERENAPHPLDEAVRLARLAKQQAPTRAKKMVENDVFVSGTVIAARKMPKTPGKTLVVYWPPSITPKSSPICAPSNRALVQALRVKAITEPHDWALMLQSSAVARCSVTPPPHGKPK